MSKSTSLRFNGSIWCNLYVALRNVDNIFSKALQSSDLSVIELYILRSLYQEDGQHAAVLAKSVGRAPTSFTPNLDGLEDKGLIERVKSKEDRRVVCIYLTSHAKELRADLEKQIDAIQQQITRDISHEDLQTFFDVLETLQDTKLNRVSSPEEKNAQREHYEENNLVHVMVAAAS